MGRAEYLRLNRSMLVAFAVGITVSALVAQQLDGYEHHLNTTVTLAADYVSFYSVLGFLLYVDNRRRYRLDSGGTDRPRLRRDLPRLVSSLGAAEIVYAMVRWSSQYYLLTIQYDPYMASILGHLVSTAVYVVTLNAAVRISRLFG